jgi:hypothetical protein
MSDEPITGGKAPPSTPANRWRAAGEPDPHAGRYDGERAALALGQYSDDELANGAFMNYDRPLDIQKALDRTPGYHSPIAWMTAVKDRIRWLSRLVEKLLAEKQWQPMDTAPKDNTLVLLLVEYSDGAHPLEDSHIARTIGHNSYGDTGEDQWQFAGWSWCQDVYTQGTGKPIAWMPMPPIPKE